MKKQSTKPEIIVVSGLPRSGTSLMMQMLQAAGLPVYFDMARPADPHNPKGYYELEAVKNLRQNVALLDRATGKAIKIISYHLTELPATFSYRIIFMQRNLNEVVLSQNAMLLRLEKPTGPLNEAELVARFSEHLRQVLSWIEKQNNIMLLEVPYTNLLKKPEHWSNLIVKFLDKNLDPLKMIEPVEPSLYHIQIK